MDIGGRVFVVTGGGNGIGREVVLLLLRRGARVAAVDVSATGMAETSALAAAGERLSTHLVDLADAEAVAALAPAVLDTHGQVDGVLNVAGIIQPFVPVRELEVAAIEKVMAVNFWGVVHMVKTFLPLLLERPAASLVNVSSMGAFAAVPGQTAYCASKAAVMLLTEGLWAELRGTSVAVTAVYPGAVATDIAAHSGAATPATDPSAAPTTITSPEEAARRIVEGMEQGAFRVVIGRDAKGLDVLSRVSPRRATEMIAKKMASLVQPRAST